jgi:hypothetical protein
MKPQDPDIQPSGFKYLVYAKEQPPYRPLPSQKNDVGDCIFQWKMSWWERLRVLFCGKVYINVLTFNKPLQPQRVSVNSKQVLRWYERA